MQGVSGVIDVVCFDYEDLKDESKDLSDLIEAAYGPDGYGICLVKNVPNYTKLRNELLPLAHKLANLPKEKLEKLEFPETFYQVGWSHGKEKFKGKEDYSKGSFYANPQYDKPKADPNIKGADIFPENKWPTEDLPELESAFKNLGQLIVNTGLLIAKHLDKYVEKKVPTYEKGKLTRIIKESQTCKARLLHYFASKDPKDAVDDWCGWHNDSDTLTGLTGAMYIDGDNKIVDFVDDESGLFIQNRKGEIKRAKIPKDCLAYQIGEASQVHSGGYLMATPHCVVRGPKLAGANISRNTFAVFMQPNVSEPMNIPEGITKEQTFMIDWNKVPKLEDRWEPNQNFYEFAQKTFKSYY